MSEIEHLHEPFMRWLRQEGIPFIRARSDRRSTLESGVHDVTVLLPRHTALCLEFKEKGNDLSKDQRVWSERCAKGGVTVYVIRKLEDAVQLVQTWRKSLQESTPLSSSSPENKTPAAPVSGSPFRLLQWCGQTWTVTQDGTKDRNGWSLLHKATPEELATLKPI